MQIAVGLLVIVPLNRRAVTGTVAGGERLGQFEEEAA